MATLKMPRRILVNKTYQGNVTLDGVPADSNNDFLAAISGAPSGSIEISNLKVVTGSSNLKYTFDFKVTAAGDVVVTIDEDHTSLGAAAITGTGDLTFTVTAIVYREGRAERNPAAKNYGTNVLAIVAEQTDYFSPVTLNSDTPDPGLVEGLHGDIVEMRPPYTLTPTRQFYEVMRLKGNPTPDPSIPGMVMGAGEMNFYLQPSALGFWFKHLLQANEVTSTKLEIPAASNGDRILAPNTRFEASGGVVGAGTKLDISGIVQPEDILHPATALTWKPPVAMVAAQVEITFSAAANGRSVRVKGTDNGGAPLEETVSAPGTDAVTTKQYFKTITEVTRIGSTTAAHTCGLKAKLSSTYRHTLKFDSDVSEGLSIEVQEGNKDAPIRYNGALVTRGIIRLEEVARAQFMIIANEVEPRKGLHHGAADSGGDGTTLTHFSRPNFDAVSAPGMAWNIPDSDDQATAIPEDMRGIYRVAQLAFAADNRIAPPQTAFAQDFFYPKPVRKTNRELQSQVVIDYSKEADFDQFTGGATFVSELIASSYPYGDAYSEIRVRNNQTQLVNNPTRVVQGLDEVLQQIVMRSHIGDAADGNDDTEITIINNRAMV